LNISYAQEPSRIYNIVQNSCNNWIFLITFPDFIDLQDACERATEPIFQEYLNRTSRTSSNSTSATTIHYIVSLILRPTPRTSSSSTPVWLPRIYIFYLHIKNLLEFTYYFMDTLFSVRIYAQEPVSCLYNPWKCMNISNLYSKTSKIPINLIFI
jgi:hypothetical protein